MIGLSYEAEVLIRRPPADVFDFCSDLRNEAEWASAPKALVEVIRHDRPRAWATRSQAMGLDVTTESSLEAVPEGTRYRLRLNGRGRGVARLWAPLALLAMRGREPENMRRIKARLEGLDRARVAQTR